MVRLQVIGGGRMGEALVAGLLDRGWAPPGEVRVVEVDEARATVIRSRFEGIEVTAMSGPAAGTVIATKPAVVAEAVASAVASGGGPILSIAAGVTIAQLEAAAGPGVAVVRAMPNTPALVGSGASCITGGSAAGNTDLDWAEGLLGAVGFVARVPESAMDGVTGLSGSGPAYVFLIAEALVDGGVAAGLPRDLATKLAVQTLLGAATMLDVTGDGPAELRAAVTSPGGTTAAALTVLERRGVRAAIIDAVAAAAARSRELSS